MKFGFAADRDLILEDGIIPVLLQRWCYEDIYVWTELRDSNPVDIHFARFHSYTLFLYFGFI
jgi:hypothetical protein